MKALYVWQRELVSLFTSPVGYVAIAAMTVINSYFFLIIISNPYFSYASLQPLLGNMSITLLFFTPAFTMRQLAEEKKSGTVELLFTSPLTDAEIVLGKYLGALTLLFASLAVSWMYVLVLQQYGEPDMGPIISGFLGVFLLGACYLVVGLFLSSTTTNQIIAFIASLGVLLVLFFLEAIAQRWETSWIGDTLKYVSLSFHYDEFAKGVIDLKDVLYYLSFIGFFLFMTVRSVESRKWR